MGDTPGTSDSQVLKKQEQPPPQQSVDDVKHANSEIQVQNWQSWVTHLEEVRKATLQRRNKIIRQKNVICRTRPHCFCGCNLPLVVILGLPAIFAYYFDPVNYLFTDSEHYSIPVSSTLKCFVFGLICVILVYCFRSRGFIIEGERSDYWTYWFITVAWVIIYCVTIFFIVRGYTILFDTYFYDIPVPLFYAFYFSLLMLPLGCCFCLFCTCFEHHY